MPHLKLLAPGPAPCRIAGDGCGGRGLCGGDGGGRLRGIELGADSGTADGGVLGVEGLENGGEGAPVAGADGVERGGEVGGAGAGKEGREHGERVIEGTSK